MHTNDRRSAEIVERILRDLPESFWDAASWGKDGNWTPGNIDIADRKRVVVKIVAWLHDHFDLSAPGKEP